MIKVILKREDQFDITCIHVSGTVHFSECIFIQLYISLLLIFKDISLHSPYPASITWQLCPSPVLFCVSTNN